MDPVLAFLGIVAALVVGAISPGPAFVFAARASVALSRADGLAAALGMGLGSLMFGTLALLGLQALLAETGWLYLALRLAGGANLLYLAWRLWHDAGAIIGLLGAKLIVESRPA
jgi:threonine/homoserine/homoserine lactone efflux protein